MNRNDTNDIGKTSAAAREGFVSKHDRHMQLINTSIYDKETQQRNKAIEETRRQKALRRDQREKLKIRKHFQTPGKDSGTATSAPVNHELTIDGLRFLVLDGGSKLARMKGKLDAKPILCPLDAHIA